MLKSIHIENLGRALHYPEGAEEDAHKVLGGIEYPMDLLLLDRVSRIVDIGAHVGLATVFFHCLFPQARITAYEPFSQNFTLLEQNTQGLPNVEILQRGLGARNEQVPLFLSDEFGGAASSVFGNDQDHKSGRSEIIQICRASLEHVFKSKEEISILKIDTEGFEVPILSDLWDVLDRVLVLCMEIHSEEDRVALDRFLTPRFILRHCHVAMVHRTTVMYLNRDAIYSGRIETRGAPPLRPTGTGTGTGKA